MLKFTAETLRAFVPVVDHPYESGLVYEGVFTPRQCERIVELGLGLAPDEARVGGAERDYVEEAATRKSRTAWIEPSDETLWIFDKLTKVAQRANRVYGFDLIGFTEDVQFTRYDEPGAFYDWHQDGLGGELAGRKLSLVVQLSDPDDYVGGELELFNIVHEMEPEDAEDWGATARQQGSVVVFPAFEYHRVLSLVSGKRYSLVSWIGGPPFR
jgi:PKHD-type hydroxylase